MTNQETRNRTRSGVIALALFGFAGLMAMLMLRNTPQPPKAEAPEPAPSVAAVEPAEPVFQTPPLHSISRPRPKRNRRGAAVEAPAPAPITLESQWGIEISSLRLSMGNSIVDLRYKVIDPQKVAQLAKGKTPAYILDVASGKKLVMPVPPKEGAFPPTGHKLEAGRTYFSMISNQGGTLRSGSEVMVVVGESQVTHLTIE